MSDVLCDIFPWVAWLPEPDRDQFAVDHQEAVRLSAEHDDWGILGDVIREWWSTAQVHADPDLLAALTGSTSGDYGPVPYPGGER